METLIEIIKYTIIQIVGIFIALLITSPILIIMVVILKLIIGE